MRCRDAGARTADARVAVIAAVLACASAWAAPPAGPAAGSGGESAVWTPRELNFVYLGFTANYSCDGLRDRMRSVLLKLGAREDLQVLSVGCVGDGRPEPFPGVRVKMNVLQPAAAPGTSAGAPAVAAHWQRVNLVAELDPLTAAADCELVRQIKQSVLPLFAARNVDYSSDCVPHQLQPGGTKLRVDVLVSDQAPAASRAE